MKPLPLQFLGLVPGTLLVSNRIEPHWTCCCTSLSQHRLIKNTEKSRRKALSIGFIPSPNLWWAMHDVLHRTWRERILPLEKILEDVQPDVGNLAVHGAIHEERHAHKSRGGDHGPLASYTRNSIHERTGQNTRNTADVDDHKISVGVCCTELDGCVLDQEYLGQVCTLQNGQPTGVHWKLNSFTNLQCWIPSSQTCRWSKQVSSDVPLRRTRKGFSTVKFGVRISTIG